MGKKHRKKKSMKEADKVFADIGKKKNKYSNLNEKQIDKLIKRKEQSVKSLNKSIPKVNYLKGNTREQGIKRAREREKLLKELRELNKLKKRFE